MSIDSTLASRKKTHGDYKHTAEVIQAMKLIARRGEGTWPGMTAQQKESLDMILHKIGRILSGDPGIADHWHDIAGYATLQERLCDDYEVSE